MRLHRFFVSHIMSAPFRKGDVFATADKNMIHQLKDVLRFKVGDSVVLLDNTGFEYESAIASLSDREVRFTIGEPKPCSNIPSIEVILFAALIRNGNFELMLEKGTEIGVSTFMPIIADRSEKKALNAERATAIIREASEQSGRGVLPTVYDALPLADALEKTGIPLVAFHPNGTPFDKVELSKRRHVGLLIGPEGGWSDRELELFRLKNVALYSFGPQILRAETAAIVASSLLLFR